MSEVNTDLGVILETLNNKLDRDLQNFDDNVDFVIRWKAPTTNDPTWYRIYKSGWCEQGGRTTQDTLSGTITYPIEMADNNYCLTFGEAAVTSDDTGGVNESGMFSDFTTTGCRYTAVQSSSSVDRYLYYRVEGLANINNI